jgi:uncharacterized protein YbjT (DUF2867 family)
MRIALIAGSTGLVGSQLLHLLLASDRYTLVKALTRKPLDIQHSKLIQIITDYRNLRSLEEELIADDVFCCLGTTMAKAGSKDKFKEVDYVFPLLLAEMAVKNRASQFMSVSALGADAGSSIYYNKVKGELEDALTKLPIPAIHIFRPSLLLGDRGEKRAGEDLAKAFYKIFWFLIPDKYKAIESAKIAKAMLHYASKDQRGIFVHESREMQHF